MRFPLGFPDSLKPRTESAVLKACRNFRSPSPDQMWQRLEAGLDACAKIVIEAVGTGEVDIGVAPTFLDQFIDCLSAKDPFGSLIAPFNFSHRMFSQMKDDLMRSDRWIGYMEQLDAITQHRARRKSRKEKSIALAPSQQTTEGVSAIALNGYVDTKQKERDRRAKLLLDYKAATTNPSNKRIYQARNSPIHKPQFYKWLKGSLPSTSATTINFERFLRERKPPVR